jgi:8-oxo-dGTP pyrophosphatase MutT (NUDIX family)
MKACDHRSVGILVRDGVNLLLIERRRPPFGMAPPAGHVDDHPSFESAAIAELREEVNLHATNLTLLIEGRKENPCRRPQGTWHYWKIFEAQWKGTVRGSPIETVSASWTSPAQIQTLVDRTSQRLRKVISDREWQLSPGVEPVWAEWFHELELATFRR